MFRHRNCHSWPTEAQLGTAQAQRSTTLHLSQKGCQGRTGCDGAQDATLGEEFITREARPIIVGITSDTQQYCHSYRGGSVFYMFFSHHVFRPPRCPRSPSHNLFKIQISAHLRNSGVPQQHRRSAFGVVLGGAVNGSPPRGYATRQQHRAIHKSASRQEHGGTRLHISCGRL